MVGKQNRIRNIFSKTADETAGEISGSYTVIIKEQEVSSLVEKLWVAENRKTILCVDSYQDGILQCRFYGPDGSGQRFQSLSRFLVLMEQMLEQATGPQSDTKQRSFSIHLPRSAAGTYSACRKGNQATFELQILFRQHTSWQGMIQWQEQRQQQRFRSVLELILLLDSALREQEGIEAG